MKENFLTACLEHGTLLSRLIIHVISKFVAVHATKNKISVTV